MQTSAIVIYAGPLIAAFAIYLWTRGRRHHADRERLREAESAGLIEPPSLHPEFDPTRCIGSSACLKACPEQAIGLVYGKARLVNPAACIGHGACFAQCPMDAIELVFGTERRGVDIPYVSPEFETNVPGLFIAGELGGMGLIHKAVEQGRSAIQTIARRSRAKAMLDVVIVGAGPSGLAASLAAQELSLRFATVEQEGSLGGTVYHYPRNKIAMTAPMRLPFVGKVKLGEVSKEALLAFWKELVKKSGLKIAFGSRMMGIEQLPEGFRVATQTGSYATRHVLLAVGRRGTPRRLEVPGEDLPKVAYRLMDAEQYRGQQVLVVGGGDSAIEAALALAQVQDTRVSLSYRGSALNRIKPVNRERLDRAAQDGKIRLLLESEVTEITSDSVALSHGSRSFRIGNDAVIVCAGGVLPTEFLRSLGVEISTHHGKATSQKVKGEAG